GLHVEDAGAVQAPVRPDQRHALELSDGPHRVEVAEEENLCRAAPKFCKEVIAAVGPRQSRDASADAPEAAGQLGAAPIDRRLVGARRLGADQRVDRVEEPFTFGAAEIAERYNRRHDRDKDTEVRAEDTEGEPWPRNPLCPLFILLCP